MIPGRLGLPPEASPSSDAHSVEIAIDYSWLIVFSLVLWSLAAGYFPAQYPGYSGWSYAAAGLAGTILFFASVLVHELSHALVANRIGARVRKITLFIFGGMAHLSGEPPDPRAELRIAAAGPLTSVAHFAVLLRAPNSRRARLLPSPCAAARRWILPMR